MNPMFSKFSIFETALLKESLTKAIVVYRSRTGRGINEAHYEGNVITQSSLESTPSLSQEESLLVTEGWRTGDNEERQKELFQKAEALYLKRTSKETQAITILVTKVIVLLRSNTDAVSIYINNPSPFPSMPEVPLTLQFEVAPNQGAQYVIDNFDIDPKNIDIINTKA